MAVNCAILSYDGNVYFGFSGDVHAAPDLKKMEGLLEASFMELRAAAGVLPQARKRVSKKRRAKSPSSRARVPDEAPKADESSSVQSRREPERASALEPEKAIFHSTVA